MLSVGMFALERVAGRGGMGEVWEARIGPHPVALKVLTAERARDGRAVAWFEREARATASLDSAWIVRVHEYGRVGAEEAASSDGRLPAGSPFLVMDWMAGGTARVLCGVAPWARVREVLRSVLKGLAHAHARGLLHLDVKPTNVLLAADGRARLADFGVSRAIGEAGGELAGTPAYMAPEQHLHDEGALGPWTDLYAVGRLALSLVGGATELAGLVPPGFSSWIDGLLATDRRDRYGCAPDALAGLEALGDAAAAVDLPAVSGDAPTVPVDRMAVPEGPAPRVQTAILLRATLPSEWEDEPSPPLEPGLGLGLFALREAPLVGRDALRQALWRSVRRESGTHLVALVGHAGAGKTRLARALAEHVRETSPATVLWSARGELDGGVAAATAVLAEAANHGPVLLVIDDAPRAGSALDLVRSSLDSPAKGPGATTILLTVREDERDAEGLPALLARGEVLEVPSLTVVEEEALLRAVLGVAPELPTRLRAQSAGYPLFILQAVGDWVARGLLAPGPSGLVLTVDEPPVAEAITATWARRVATVAARVGRPEVAFAFEIAAVLGTPVTTAEWTAAIAHLGLDAPAVLDAGFRAGLLVRSAAADGSWQLVHGLLGETLIHDAGEGGRLEAHHRRCAEAVVATDWRSKGRMGGHLLRGGLPREALEPLKAASTEAIRLGLPRDALRIADDFGAAVASAGAGEAWEAEVALQQARINRGLRRSSREPAERVVAIAGRLSDKRLLAEGMLMLGLSLDDEGNIDGEVEAFREASRLFTAIGDEHGIARAELRVGWGLLRRRNVEEAAPRFAMAAATFARTGDRVSQAMALLGGGEAATYVDPPRARECFLGAYALFQGLGHVAGQIDCMVNLGVMARMANDLDDAELRFREAVELVRTSQMVDFYPSLNLANLRGMKGHHEEAAATLFELRERVRAQPLRELMVLTAVLPNVADTDEATWQALIADTDRLATQTGLKSPVARGMLERAAKRADALGLPDRAVQARVLRDRMAADR